MKKLKQMLKSDKSESKTASTPTSQQTPSLTTSSSQPQTSQQTLSNEPAKGVLITTNYGDITIALYSDETPKVIISLPPFSRFPILPFSTTSITSTGVISSSANTTRADMQELCNPGIHAQIR